MTKEILLTRGQRAVVDDDDYEWLSQYKWHALWCKHTESFIAVRGHRTVLMTHDIMNPPDGMMVDHINHDTLDNRRFNLRVCTKTQNQFNAKLRRDSTSGYKGVGFHKVTQKWMAYIRANNVQYHLGLFKTIREAVIARNVAAIKYHGEYAYLNPVPEEENA